MKTHTTLLSHSWIRENIHAQRFCENLRQGWKICPEALDVLQSGEETSTELSQRYFDDAPADVKGLTFDEVVDCIEYCLKDPNY